MFFVNVKIYSTTSYITHDVRCVIQTEKLTFQLQDLLLFTQRDLKCSNAADSNGTVCTGSIVLGICTSDTVRLKWGNIYTKPFCRTLTCLIFF